MRTGSLRRRGTCGRLPSVFAAKQPASTSRGSRRGTMQQIENHLFKQPLADLVAKLGYFRRLERIWKLIEKDYADSDLDLATAARVSGISRNHLNVMMRRETGFTFYQPLIRYRLFQALTMIRSRNYSCSYQLSLTKPALVLPYFNHASPIAMSTVTGTLRMNSRAAATISLSRMAAHSSA